MTIGVVGGKNVLYRGMIYLDLGILAGSLFDHPITYTVVYIALLHVFSGAVDILRANESRKIGAHWRLKMAYGVTGVLLAVAVVISGVVYKSPLITTYIYGAGLIYSALLRIAGAFRRTEIVYIQYFSRSSFILTKALLASVIKSIILNRRKWLTYSII